MADFIGTFFSGILLIAIYSYLFKNTRAYRYTEHIYVGFAAAHAFVTGWRNIKEEAVHLFYEGKWSAALPLVLGLLLYTKFNKKIAYFSRTSFAFMMGVAAGVTITGSLEASFVTQIRATVLSLTSLNNLVVVLGTVSTLCYFLFIPLETVKGAKGQFNRIIAQFSSGLSMVGRTTMMVAFGSSFGFVVMARLSNLVGRLQFFLSKCIPLIR